MSLLKDFEALCKYVRECTGDDIVCGLCEYDAGTVGEEPMECPGFESNECFVLKESLRKQYEMYAQVIRCNDCKYDHTCTHMMVRKSSGGGNIYCPVTYCSKAERKDT